MNIPNKPNEKLKAENKKIEARIKHGWVEVSGGSVITQK